MKASKFLASAVAAAAVVGLVYAQAPDTTTQPAMPADSSQTLQNQGAAGQSTGSMQTPAASDTAGLKAERPAQADRN